MVSSHSIRHFGRASMAYRVVKKSKKIPTVFQGDKKGGPHRRHKALHYYIRSASPLLNYRTNTYKRLYR